MANILKRIWIGIVRFFASTFYVWISVILGAIAGWIFGGEIGIWVFFGGVLSVIALVFFRQIWWFISGTGDYTGRVGLLKKLYLWLKSR